MSLTDDAMEQVERLFRENIKLRQRAETAERALAEMRERLGEAAPNSHCPWCGTPQRLNEDGLVPRHCPPNCHSTCPGTHRRPSEPAGEEVPLRLHCGCLGFCEGGPECLDDEGGPWPQGPADD